MVFQTIFIILFYGILLQNYDCLCSIGYEFRDNSSTVCSKQNRCDFKCSMSGECLENSQRCNGKLECLDFSDEKDCEKDVLTCNTSQFMCEDGTQCIPQKQRCDLIYNCRDHSDEKKCSFIEEIIHCKRNQLRCPNGHCFDVNMRCDGRNNCGDNYDERQEICQSPCPVDFFKCSSGQCIPKNYECNSFIDCQDYSDEHSGCRKYLPHFNLKLFKYLTIF